MQRSFLSADYADYRFGKNHLLLSVAYRDKLWIFGVKTGVDYKQADDIWYMTK